MRKKIRRGHQAPIGWRINKFNSIEINGNFAYCKSHNFVYDVDIEEYRLYQGLPCYHTDARYRSGGHNYYHNTMLHWTRFKDVSLKACIRKTLACRNIPKGTDVQFKKSWHFGGTRVDNSYVFTVRKENHFDPDYQINDPRCSTNFSTCEFSQTLTDRLRENGFIVFVEANSSFLLGMINSAIAVTGRGDFVDSKITGEVAMAYGHGKIIGYSSYDDDYKGYSDGCENVLWDNYGEFDKWSRCLHIKKSTPIDEIISILTTEQLPEE